MESFSPRNEVEAWNTSEVADKVSSFLGTSDLRDNFLGNNVDGGVLLHLTLSTMKEGLEIYSFGYKYKLDRWLEHYRKANIASEDVLISAQSDDEEGAIEGGKIKQVSGKVDASLKVSKELVFVSKKASEPSKVKEVGACEQVIQASVIYSAENFPYNTFSLSQKDCKKWLKVFSHYMDTYKMCMSQLRECWKHDIVTTIIQSKVNLRHKGEMKDQMKAYIKSRLPELNSIVIPSLNEGSTTLTVRFTVDDVFKRLLNSKHYKTKMGKTKDGKGLQTVVAEGQRNSSLGTKLTESSNLAMPLQLSKDDIQLLQWVKEGYELQLFGVKQKVASEDIKACEDGGTPLAGDGQRFYFGKGVPIKPLRKAPYDASAIRLKTAFLEKSLKKVFVPSGEEFANFDTIVTTLKQGMVIEMPRLYCCVCPNPPLTSVDLADTSDSDMDLEKGLDELPLEDSASEKDDMNEGADANKDHEDKLDTQAEVAHDEACEMPNNKANKKSSEVPKVVVDLSNALQLRNTDRASHALIEKPPNAAKGPKPMARSGGRQPSEKSCNTLKINNQSGKRALHGKIMANGIAFKNLDSIYPGIESKSTKGSKKHKTMSDLLDMGSLQEAQAKGTRGVDAVKPESLKQNKATKMADYNNVDLSKFSDHSIKVIGMVITKSKLVPDLMGNIVNYIEKQDKVTRKAFKNYKKIAGVELLQMMVKWAIFNKIVTVDLPDDLGKDGFYTITKDLVTLKQQT